MLPSIPREAAIASDTDRIVDHTISIGTTKCFLVLGIRQEHFRQLGRPLEHRDMHVLALIPVEQSNGEIVHGQFKELASKVGVPKCILSDHGSDLKKGSELFLREHPDVLICYDIVHAVSRMMQRILSRDKRWDDYRKACCQCANLTRQSGMSHLKPPKPKTKARYVVRRHGYSKRLGEQMRAAIAVPKNETAADLVNAIYEFSDGVAASSITRTLFPVVVRSSNR